MRTREEILNDYRRSKENDELITDPKYSSGRVSVWRNEEWRNRLQKEYDKTLTLDKQVAIWLHDKNCRCSGCTFHLHRQPLEHDWDYDPHNIDYLLRARKLLKQSRKYHVPLYQVKKLVLAAIEYQGGIE